MSYRDPQQVIDNRYAIISQGVAQLLGNTTKRLDTYTAQKEKEKAEYKKVIDKSKRTNKRLSDAAYMKAKKASDKFSQGIYGKTSEGGAEERVLFDEQINGIFNTWGTELNNKISQIQAEGGDESEITELTNSYIQKVDKFTTDIANWEAARQEYAIAQQAAIEGGYNSVGTLLADPEQQRNPELIGMFNAMTDDELDNVYITIDPSGNTRMSLGSITDGKFDAQSTSDLTAMVANHAESPDGKYFITNEQFDQNDYKAMEGLLGDLEANEALLVNGQLDRDLARDYLLNDELGRNYMDSFLVDGGVSKWASLYPSEDVSRQYTDDDYLGQIFDNTWDSSYSHKQKKAKQSQRKKSATSPTKAFSDTRTALNIPDNTITGVDDRHTEDDVWKGKKGTPEHKAWVAKKRKESEEMYKEQKSAAAKIVKKTKNMTKDQIVNLGKEEIAKLTKQEKDKIKKIKTGSKDNYKGLPPEAYVIDQNLGYPLMRYLFGELAYEEDETDAERNNKEGKVPKEVIAMNKSREKV
jgi:hypothetical protein